MHDAQSPPRGGSRLCRPGGLPRFLALSVVGLMSSLGLSGCGWLAAGIALGIAASVDSDSSTGDPPLVRLAVEEVTPNVVARNAAFTLTIYGEGFTDECSVFLRCPDDPPGALPLAEGALLEAPGANRMLVWFEATDHVGRAEHETRADGRTLEGPVAQRAEGLARLYLGRRDRAQGLLWLERALERCEPRRHGGLAFSKAEALRLVGQRERALTLFLALADDPSHGAPLVAASLVEAARLLLRAGERERASACTARARDLAECALVGPDHARVARAVTALEARL